MIDSIGDRMKKYEDAFRYHLPPRMSVVIRVDGKAFHSLTKKAVKPFDHHIEQLMNETTLFLCKEVGTVQFAYVQSDEISLFLHPYKKLTSQAWFDNTLQKMVSVSAALATAGFNEAYEQMNWTVPDDCLSAKFGSKMPAVFDSRVFVLPECEVVNYFLWRQQDATRNSISMLAQSLYSNKELHKKNNKEMQEMTFQKGQNWNDIPTYRKRGRCCVKTEVNRGFDVLRKEWMIDNEIPVFSQDRDYIGKYVGHVEEIENA